MSHEPDFPRVTESPETYLPEDATCLLRVSISSRARHRSNAMKFLILLCVFRDVSSRCDARYVVPVVVLGRFSRVGLAVESRVKIES
jgi:hypothetical protein